VAIQYAYNNNVAAGALTLSGGITLSSTSTLDAVRSGGLIDVATNAITGAGGLNIASSASSGGVVRLSAANTYTGATTITTGTLQLEGSTHASSAVGIGTAGTLTGSGTVNGNATLTGGGIINKSAGSIAGTLAVTGGNWNGAGTVTGAVTSSSGTFIIGSGANLTSTAGASATGGALVVNGTLTGTLSANSSTTVSGSGTITGNTTISGIHSPGNSPGIQSYGSNLSYTSGSSVTWELGVNALGLRGTDFDGINVGGVLDFSGATAVNLAFGFAGSSVNWTDAFWDTSRTGTAGWLVYDVAGTTTNFANLSVNTINWFDGSGASFDTSNPGNTFSLYQDGNDIYLNYTVIPEPNVAALLGGLGTLLLLRRRR
jgi:autotransporter-associated beta strand protein